MIKQYRYFAFCIQAQERYLNRMASKGYRLTKCHIASYEFEKTKEALCYELVYIADRNATSFHQFQAMLDELHYTYFFKNINLNYTLKRAKLRFTGHGLHMQTTEDLINRELLIIEKPLDCASFLYNSIEEWIYYYKGIRNVVIQYVILVGVFACLLSYQQLWMMSLLLWLITFGFGFGFLLIQRKLHAYQKEGTIYE